MSVLDQLLGKTITTATAAASEAASAKAAAAYEAYKPLIYAVAFMGATAYLFFFIPRFALPWQRPGAK